MSRQPLSLSSVAWPRSSFRSSPPWLPRCCGFHAGSRRNIDLSELPDQTDLWAATGLFRAKSSRPRTPAIPHFSFDLEGLGV